MRAEGGPPVRNSCPGWSGCWRSSHPAEGRDIVSGDRMRERLVGLLSRYDMGLCSITLHVVNM